MHNHLKSIKFLVEKEIKHEVKEFSSDTDKGAVNVAKCFDKDPRSFLKSLIFQDSEEDLYMCLVGGDQHVELSKLKKVVGKDSLRMAKPNLIKEQLGYIIGSIPPFGLDKDIPVFIEQSLEAEEEFGVGTGQWGIEIFISPENLIEASSAKYVDLIEDSYNFDWDSKIISKEYEPRIESAADLDEAITIKDFRNNVGQEVTLSGWVNNLRSSGKIMFIQFRDGTGDTQVIVEKSKLSEDTWEEFSELTQESSLQITGTVIEEPRSPSGFEINATGLKVIQIAPEYPISNKEHGPKFLLDNRHLWLRSSKQRAVLRIRDEIFFSLQKFLRTEDFVRIDTPIFQPVSCEDTSELFSVDYFGEETYLTQSGQLYCEAAEMALGRTYDFGPVFRAEKSKTRKHLIEFWMMDAELPFTTMEGMMDFEEKMMKTIIKDCIDNCSKSLEILERDIPTLQKYVSGSFVRMTHADAIDLLNDKFDQKLNKLDDIGAPEEVKLSELYDMPIFITDWPAEIKAFYMSKSPKSQSQDGIQRVRAVDLVAPEGFGEIIGGSERIFSYNELLGILRDQNYRFEDYEWYMDLRKYGTIPHSGFGIGLERTVRWISGIQHIRESIPFPRMLNRLYP